MQTQTQDRVLCEKLGGMWGLLDERTRRLVAASEARALGHGGVRAVQRACGMSRVTITKGSILDPEEVPVMTPRRKRKSA